MYSTTVQSIRNKLEQQIDNNNRKSDRFVLKRSATSLGTIDTNLVKLNLNSSAPNPTKSPPKFNRAKTSVDLLKSDIKNNNLNRANQPLLSRQLSDPIKKGNIKRTPAFRCEKFIDCDQVLLSNLSSKSNFTNKIRMFEQCQSKRSTVKPSDSKLIFVPEKYSEDNSEDSVQISNSPTKFKSNKLLREELDLITKRRDELSRSSNSRSSSSSPVTVPIKIIPEYSQVLKHRKKKLTTFAGDKVLDENLTDTLKKALKSPLPEGPPPKKPPRTFAHSKTTPNIAEITQKLSQQPMFVDTGQENRTERKVKSKTDPRLMLDKLENALLQNKIRSPRSRRKIVDVENVRTSINNNLNETTTSPQKNAFFNDCFPICANANEYAKPLRSKSEFFVDKNILMHNNASPNRIADHHIYAEPFQFKTDVPDNFNCRIRRSDLIQTPTELIHPTGGHEKILENIKSSPDLHYLSTPVPPTVFTTSPRNNLNKKREDFGQAHRTSFEKIIRKDINTDKNLFDVGQLPQSISPIFQNSSTDSDFESSASTPSCDEQLKNFLNNPNESHIDLSINNNLYYALTTNKMSQTNENLLNNNNILNEKTSPTPVGRVRALVQKLESVDKSEPNVLDNNIKKVTPKAKVKNESNLIGNLSRNQYFIEKLSQQLLALDSENDSFDNVEHKELKHNVTDRHEISKKLSIKHKMYVKRVSSRVDKYAKVISQNACSPHLFDCCLLVGLNMSTKKSYIKSQYPENVNVPPAIETLCFPDANHWNWNLNSKEYGGTYTLIITNENGDRRFGFCRRVLPEGEVVYLPLVYCLLSPFRAVHFFNKVLKEIESRHGLPDFILNTFLEELYNTPFPKPGTTVSVKYLKSETEIQADEDAAGLKSITNGGDCLDGDKTPKQNNCDNCVVLKRSIQRSHSSPLLNADKKTLVTEIKECELEFSRPYDTRIAEEGLAVLLDTLNVTIVLQIFSSLLLERKIILLCLTISKLSTCMEALQTMLHPFAWQHTFISVLPSDLVDIFNAPTPFLIGALTTACEHFIDIEDGIVVDLDKAQVLRKVGDENDILPTRIQNFLKLALNSDDIKTSKDPKTRNLLISEAFIGAFLHLCGNYKEFIVEDKNGEQIFEKEDFIKSSNSKGIQLFLEWYTETSMFNAFIDSQLNSNRNERKCETDHFQQKIDAFMLKKNKKKTLGEKIKNWTHFN